MVHAGKPNAGKPKPAHPHTPTPPPRHNTPNSSNCPANAYRHGAPPLLGLSSSSPPCQFPPHQVQTARRLLQGSPTAQPNPPPARMSRPVVACRSCSTQQEAQSPSAELLPQLTGTRERPVTALWPVRQPCGSASAMERPLQCCQLLTACLGTGDAHRQRRSPQQQASMTPDAPVVV